MAHVSGYTDLTIRARSALLDALIALRNHRDSLVLVGAQAVYVHTGAYDVAIATETTDSNIAVLPEDLAQEPLLEDAMAAAHFHPDAVNNRQGLWISADGIEVELLVPDGLQEGSSRGARIPPHDKRAARRVPGLEAAAVDHALTTVCALGENDERQVEVKVAGPAALVVSKLHKITDRLRDREAGRKDRLSNKDAHDVFRLLNATSTEDLAATFRRLLQSEICGQQTAFALEALAELASTPEAPLCAMAGQAEALVGDPADIATRTWALSQDLVDALK